jgi:hypothetical protein
MNVRRSLLKGTVAVETYGGGGSYGPVYAAAVTVRCNVDATRRLVRGSDGVEVVSEATLAVHPSDAGVFTPESRVTIDGRASRVLTASPQTFRGGTAFLAVSCA